MSGVKSTFVPNSFQTPNGYVDDLMPYLTGEEYKVLIYATRRILGFQKRQDRISLSQFTDGTKSIKDGRTLDNGTGLGKQTVINCLDNLLKFGLMVKEADNDPRTNEGTLWGLQWDENLINWTAIKEQVEKRSKANVSRMQKARSVRQTAVCETDLSLACETDRAPVCETDSQKTVLEIQLKTGKEEGELKKLFLKASEIVFSEVKDLPALRLVTSEIESSCISIDGDLFIVSGLPSDRSAFYADRYRIPFEQAFIGILGREVSIKFMSSGDVSRS